MFVFLVVMIKMQRELQVRQLNSLYKGAVHLGSRREAESDASRAQLAFSFLHSPGLNPTFRVVLPMVINLIKITLQRHAQIPAWSLQVCLWPAP